MDVNDAIDDHIEQLWQTYEQLKGTNDKPAGEISDKEFVPRMDFHSIVRVYNVLSAILEFYKLKDKIVPESERIEYVHRVEQLEALEDTIRTYLVKVDAVLKNALGVVEELGGDESDT